VVSLVQCPKTVRPFCVRCFCLLHSRWSAAIPSHVMRFALAFTLCVCVVHWVRSRRWLVTRPCQAKSLLRMVYEGFVGCASPPEHLMNNQPNGMNNDMAEHSSPMAQDDTLRARTLPRASATNRPLARFFDLFFSLCVWDASTSAHASCPYEVRQLGVWCAPRACLPPGGVAERSAVCVGVLQTQKVGLGGHVA
jgi:hypothetical protein